MERAVITPENIFEMCELADDVLYELRMTSFGYDLSTLERIPPDKPDHADIKTDFMKMSMAKEMDISEVDELTVSEIRSRYLAPFLPLARMFFRDEGSYSHCNYYVVDKNISDVYLDNLLCERFRDLLRICVIRRFGTEFKGQAKHLNYSTAKRLYLELKHTSELDNAVCASVGSENSGEINALLDALSNRAIEYAMLRAHHSTLTDKAAIARNSARTQAHDLLMQSAADYVQYIKCLGLEEKVDKSVFECLQNRKTVGELACYIAYEKAMGE